MQPQADFDPMLLCAARGCQNRWTVDAGNGRLCSAHAWTEPIEWPAITERQQWNETERAQLRGIDRVRPAPLTAADKTAILQRMRSLTANFGKPADPKAWARRLKARDESGERLTRQQRDAWRVALAAVRRPSDEDIEP